MGAIVVDNISRSCEEAVGSIGIHPIQCNAPAVALIQHIGRNEGPYFMCGPCSNHNVKNRHAKAILVVAAVLVVAGKEEWIS